MGRDHMDSAKAAAEADRIASVAEANFKQVVLSLKNSLKNSIRVVRKTLQMLEVDPKCICADSCNGQSKRERRDELHRRAGELMHVLEKSNGMIKRCNFFTKIDEIGPDAMLVQPKHPAGIVRDDKLLWCDRVCAYEKVDMDSTVWCRMPPTILELVFARLPLDHMFRVRGLSKHWRDSIMSPFFQHAFGTTTSPRFAIVIESLLEPKSFLEPFSKKLWSFGIRERKQYTLPFDFLPREYNNPVAGDGGLLCCRHQGSSNRRNKDLYVCNPLTQAWRKLLLPSQVRRFDLIHMVTNKQTKQYTITVVSDHLQHHAKAVVEVYNSARKTWSTSGGDDGVELGGGGGNNLFYYKKYVDGKFVGIRAYNKTTGCSTSIPSDFLDVDDIIYSEKKGFFPLVEHQGQMYVLRTTEAMEMSGVWVLRPPSHKWEKLYSVPKPKDLKYFLLSLIVSAEMIIICSDPHFFYNMDIRHTGGPEDPLYFWTLNRAQETWIDMTKHKLYSLRSPHIMFEMRLDAVP